MAINNVFLNLSDAEFKKAKEWFEHLRTPEQEKVMQTLDIINNTEFTLDGMGVDINGEPSFIYRFPTRTPLAVLVAGTSIDTNTYTDIDLFALTQDTLYNEARYHRITAPRTQFEITLEDSLPLGVYNVNYQEREDFKYALTPKESVKMGLGAIITVTLLNELSGFEKQRPRRKDDLIEPPGHLGAEKVIEYNRSIETKFLVLSRQYNP